MKKIDIMKGIARANTGCAGDAIATGRGETIACFAKTDGCFYFTVLGSGRQDEDKIAKALEQYDMVVSGPSPCQAVW